METLYELADNYKAVKDMLDTAETDEDLQALMDTLDAINDALEVKVENTLWVIETLKAEKEMFTKLANDAATAKKKRDANIERLKHYIDEQLQKAGIEKLQAGAFKLSYRKSESVLITDDQAIPDIYLKVKKEADKTAIKKAIKEGLEVDGAELVTNKNLQMGIR